MLSATSVPVITGTAEIAPVRRRPPFFGFSAGKYQLNQYRAGQANLVTSLVDLGVFQGGRSILSRATRVTGVELPGSWYVVSRPPDHPPEMVKLGKVAEFKARFEITERKVVIFELVQEFLEAVFIEEEERAFKKNIPLAWISPGGREGADAKHDIAWVREGRIADAQGDEYAFKATSISERRIYPSTLAMVILGTDGHQAATIGRALDARVSAFQIEAVHAVPLPILLLVWHFMIGPDYQQLTGITGG